MTQSQIDRAVSRATGESIDEIRRRGFSLADLPDISFDPEPVVRPPQVVNWDELDAQRLCLFP
jgi:hypothetical protein